MGLAKKEVKIPQIWTRNEGMYGAQVLCAWAKKRKRVTVYLLNEEKIDGRLLSVGQYELVIQTNDTDKLDDAEKVVVFKHAISNIERNYP